MKDLFDEIKKFMQNKIFIICLILTAILSFGFGITHISIGIDDLCFDRYGLFIIFLEYIVLHHFGLNL